MKKKKYEATYVGLNTEKKFLKSNWHHFKTRAPMCAKIYLQTMHRVLKRGRSVLQVLSVK